jgi:hypothetical protein
MHCQSPTRKQRPKNATPARSDLLSRERDNENALQHVDQLKPIIASNNATPARSNLLSRESDIENALQRMDQLKLTDTMFAPPSPGASPVKKTRKMGTRKWDLGPEDQI